MTSCIPYKRSQLSYTPKRAAIIETGVKFVNAFQRQFCSAFFLCVSLGNIKIDGTRSVSSMQRNFGLATVQHPISTHHSVRKKPLMMDFCVLYRYA